MITDLRTENIGNGSEIQLRANLDQDYDGLEREIYLFRKNGSSLTAGEKTACQEFVAKIGPKPAGIRVHKWFWYTTRGYVADRFGAGNVEVSRNLDFYDYDVEIGQTYKIEKAVSGNETAVTVKNKVATLYGVWERDDIYEIGLNYATGGSTSGKVITVGAELPTENTPVLVEYLARYDDAIQYNYTVMGYDRTNDEWQGDMSVSCYARYDYT